MCTYLFNEPQNINEYGFEFARVLIKGIWISEGLPINLPHFSIGCQSLPVVPLFLDILLGKLNSECPLNLADTKKKSTGRKILIKKLAIIKLLCTPYPSKNIEVKTFKHGKYSIYC